MKKSKFSEVRGITLISTMIIMLILVGVSISVSLNGGLFETAKKATATDRVSEAREEEQQLSGGFEDLNKYVE